MKAKRIAALLAALLLVHCCASCGKEDSSPEESPSVADNYNVKTGGSSLKLDGATPEPSQSPTSPLGGIEMPAPLSLSLDGETGDLMISRPEGQEVEFIGDPGWTIFVYMCGSDLESEGGMATDDLLEMSDFAGSEDVRFIIEAGGTGEWYLSGLSPDSMYRIMVQEGELYSLWEGDPEGMGRSDTLSEFLTWGVENYASEHMGLVFWDHGGGSITGVCFDELDDYDSLSLREIDEALLTVYGAIGRKFDFIGFDACLMCTLETANIVASYADWMYASQELEPGSGWDYTAIGEYLTANPKASGKELGVQVCDSFRYACMEDGEEDSMTMCVVDLSFVDDLILAFNSFAESMYYAGENSESLTEMARGIERADNFGGNNRSEGYTNMVDLYGLVSACSGCADGSKEVMQALMNAASYCVNGADHSGAGGLSIYYPLCVQGSEEMAAFSEICVSPWYLAFVDRQSYGRVNEGAVDGYESEQWTDAGWDWFWTAGEETEEYWSYLDDMGELGESPLITFEQEPGLDEDGYYCFVLDEDGLYFTLDVYGCVYEITEDWEDVIELGETLDIYGEWDTGYFCDEFDGYWLSLPDGQNLALYIVDYTDDYVVYTSPIELNGRETNLRLRQYYDGEVIVEGAWAGLSDSGAAARDTIPLEPGDVIVPLYYSYSLTGGEDSYYVGWEYTITGELEISYDLLESGDYMFGFCIDDIYGDYVITDFTSFTVDEYGEVYYDEY